MKTLQIALSTLILLSLPLVSFAETTTEILTKVSQNKGQSFTANRMQKLVRTNLKLEANASIDYVDSKNFSISVKNPGGIAGIKFATNYGKSTIFFPYERLAFVDALASSGDMITDTIMGKISTDIPLLLKNYNVVLKVDDQIASIPTYVIQLVPKPEIASKSYWATPGRTFWINKNNYQILREDRSWAENSEPFFTSQYTQYKTLSYSESPNVKLRIPYNVKKVPLAMAKNSETDTFMTGYKSVQEAEKALKQKIETPKYLPAGFKFREIQALNFYDTRIIIQKYDDGVNSMFLTYRTKPNLFLTLLAGKFSLDLLHKMSDLSYHAPYNYMTKETNENLVISFGDLYPDDLKKVNDSVAVK
ncbi:MAG: hypothetical protein U0354_10335 [Candidatus Sericytochromatia bacterium]